jgi:OOP family OmpA-OmpF porin
VPDNLDKCPGTPKGVKVDKKGCPLDSDGDGVADYLDKCPGTPKGVKVDKVGCPLDSDGDGVADYLDKCPGTPKGVKVDKVGCPLDSDGDGVPDNLDKCPGTPKGVKVDDVGCPLDSDGDGVADYLDKCPDTPKGAPVNSVGCWIIKGINFDYDKSDIKPQYHDQLQTGVRILTDNPTIKVQVQGHTDSKGSDAYNQALSERRAEAVKNYIVAAGIDASRISSSGVGEAKPIATNETAEGRAQNRRIEIKILKR